MARTTHGLHLTYLLVAGIAAPCITAPNVYVLYPHLISLI
jgi:hypothetical protein